MNCKPGDLAIIVRSMAGNEGKIVSCMKFYPVVDFVEVGKLPAWKVDAQVKTFAGHMSDVVPDAWLRPIRDQDGEDEMLRIVGHLETV